MNIKIIFSGLLASIILSSCLDCMDCQSTTNINLSIEYYSSNNGTITLDSTNNFNYSGPGYISGTLPNVLTANMGDFLSPVSVRESCGEDLKNINNSTINFESTVGDSSALFKYNWSESWDCK